jgi:hypothetical protein
MKKLIIVLLFGFSSLTALGQLFSGITAQEASLRIGDSVTVVDKVFSGKLLKNGMTLLNLGGNFPNHLLVVMIKSEDDQNLHTSQKNTFWESISRSPVG